jgi:hypothetical protein
MCTWISLAMPHNRGFNCDTYNTYIYNMSWYFSTSPNLSDFTEYFDFNQIPYQLNDIWDPTLDVYGRHCLPKFLLEQIDAKLVIDYSELFVLIQFNYNAVIKFLENNKIIVYQDIDSFFAVSSHQILMSFDKIVPSGCIHFVFDAAPSDMFWANSFKNIKCTVLKYNAFLKLPRVFGSKLEKNKNSKDFLLTTIKRKERPHRQLLWQELQTYPQLFDNSIVFYKSKLDNWVGQTPHQHNWFDGYPSMDLYSNVYIELVPETLYKDGFFITEKTVKPIATKTPFLMISNCKYLQFLKQQGFKTFDSLIDESYDSFYRIEDRVKSAVASLNDIVINGVEDFYCQSKSILEYNQQHLMQISGGWRYYRDLDYRDIVDKMS